MKKVRQLTALLLSAIMVFSFLAVGVSAAELPDDQEITTVETAGEEAQAEEAAQPETLSVGGNYDFNIVTEVFEYGQDVVAVIIDVGETILSPTVWPSTFTVTTTNRNPNDGSIVYEGARKVTRAYVEKQPVLGDGDLYGKYIILELEHGFGVEGASALVYSGRNYVLDMDYQVTQNLPYVSQSGLSILGSYTKAGETNLIVDEFAYGEEDGMLYRLFTPADASVAQPLVIWLHGGGERGDNNESQLRANMGGTAWASPENQAARPAYVLAPQGPNGWTNAEFDKIHALVQRMIAEGKVDASRVYVAGCSMGGGGTWNFLLRYPELFAAALPICPAGGPTVDDVDLVKDIPLWMFHAANDPTIDVARTQATYQLLTEADRNAPAYYTEFEDVGGYDGHWSWVPVLNNYEDAELGPVMDWLFAQKKAAQAPAYDFEIITKVFDYGQDVIAVAIDMGEAVDAGTITAETFAVSTTNRNPNNDEVAYEGPRAITKAYVNDQPNVADTGKDAGRYIILELENGFGVSGASTLVYTGRNYVLNMAYEVEQLAGFDLVEGGAVAEAVYNKAGEINLIVDDFTYEEKDGLLYRQFTPADTNENEALPLVMWLHGSGESGDNNEAQIRANMGGTAWASPENQAVRPAYVVAPQTSTGWAEEDRAKAKAIIDDLVAAGKVDPDRIYVAGCSMGGGGSWNILLDFPDYFAAALITATGTVKTDEELATLTHVPIWLTNTGDDAYPGIETAYNNLLALGGNVLYTRFEAGSNGPGYNNHWTWVHVLNNDYVEAYETDFMTWLFSQKKAGPKLDFSIITEVFEYGQDVIAVAIDTGAEVDASAIPADAFAVSTTNSNPNNGNVVYEGPRAVTKAYVSDKADVGEGAASGRYIILELANGFSVSGASTLVYTGRNYVLDMAYEIEQLKDFALKDGKVVSGASYTKAGEINRVVDEFAYGEEDGLLYRLFTPENTTSQPLVIWLHGAGERGDNNESQLRANMGGTAWALAENQAERPAYVLAPQCSSGWTSAEFDKLYALVQRMITEGKVDKSRVYIAGCSMGGGGTWNFMLRYPELFAASVPICAAGGPTAENVDVVKDIPLWLFHAANDPTVGVARTRDTYDLLLAAERTEVHYTEFEDVGSYNGHWSWIPVLNNYVDDELGSVMDWMFAQRRTTPVESVKVNEGAYLTMRKGATLQLTATVLPADAGNKAVTWTSAAPANASVDENGLVTAHKTGMTMITVTAANGVKTTVTIRVLY